jgi:hypothetical protein
METVEVKLQDLSTAELEKLLQERKDKERQERESKKLNYEQLRNDTVEKLIPMAAHLRDALVDFKRLAFGEITAIHELLKEYSVRHEKGKGNFQILNGDATMRIRFRNNEFGYFDERSTQAEKHIIDFLDKQFAGDAQTRELLGSLVQRSKGRLDINQVQRLYKYEDSYDDANWREGIKLLKESWTAGKTKWYAQFEVLINETWTPIVMDFASYEISDNNG